jgi:serine/threonine protein kinase
MASTNFKYKDDPLVGRVLENGKYQVKEYVAEGAMGKIYKAFHSLLKKEIAIKVFSALPPSHVAQKEVQAWLRQAHNRFIEEAKITFDLTHPNIIRIYDLNRIEITGQEFLFIVMEWLKGKTLRELINQEPILPLTRIKSIFEQICSAIIEAHKKKIIHRDLKPENIFLTQEGDTHDVVKILDFGIAKLFTEGTSKLTNTGFAMGTPGYISPEQIRDASRVDIRTDIWSLGVILYELIYGDRPFQGKNAMEILSKILEKQPPFETSPRFSEEINKVIKKALEKDREKRFKSCQEFWQETKKALDKLLETEQPKPQIKKDKPQQIKLKLKDKQDNKIPSLKPPPTSTTSMILSKIQANKKIKFTLTAISGLFLLLGTLLIWNPSKWDNNKSLKANTLHLPRSEKKKKTNTNITPPQKNVKINFITEPKGAKVFHQGEFFCQTPCKYQFPRLNKTVEFTFRLKGFQEKKIQKTLLKDEEIKIALKKIRKKRKKTLNKRPSQIIKPKEKSLEIPDDPYTITKKRQKQPLDIPDDPYTIIKKTKEK